MTKPTKPTRSIVPLTFVAVLLAACGGGGGSGPVGPGPQPPGPIPTGPATADHAGLTSLAATSGQVRVHWDAPGTGFEFAVVHGSSSTNLMTAGTAVTGLSGGSAVISSLPNNAVRYFALGVRPQGSAAAYTQVGQILRAIPATPLYVDAARATNGNGTIGSPFNTLQAAANAAAGLGGANIWIRDGSYARAILSPGTHLFGGFPDAAFTLASRDPAAGNTVVNGSAGLSTLDVSIVGDRVTIDGLALRGNGTGLYGIDTEGTDIEIRSCSVRGFVDRGIRMRSQRTTENATALLVNVASQQNGADGLSVLGAYALHVDGCSFDGNAQEGIDLGPLIVLDVLGTTLEVTASRFANNGSEGLDASLDALPLQITGSATAVVRIRGCVFTGNALDGLLIDQEHERLPGWSTDIEVRECTASNNALAGVHVDYDAPGRVLLHRLRSTANGTDGIQITSELSTGHEVVSSCELAGNLGAGLRAATGNKVAIASHCVFSGNQDGGFLCPVKEGTAASCVFRLQPNPLQNVRALGNATVTDPAAAVFQNAPVAFGEVLSHSNGALGLTAAADFAAGNTVELGDDGTGIPANQVNGTAVVLGNTPSLLRLPAALAAFGTSSVDENLQLAAGAVIAGLGMREAGAAVVDPGPYGAPTAGGPGVVDTLPERLLWLDQITPAPGQALGGSTAVSLRFSATLASGADLHVKVVNGSGNAIAAGSSVSGNTITLTPPGGGWPAAPLRVEVHRAVAAGSTLLSHPCILALK